MLLSNISIKVLSQQLSKYFVDKKLHHGFHKLLSISMFFSLGIQNMHLLDA
jgi:hypothetical protein